MFCHSLNAWLARVDNGPTLSKKGQASKIISKKESIEVPEIGGYASSFNNSNPDFPSFAESSGAKKSSVMTKGKKQKGANPTESGRF